MQLNNVTYINGGHWQCVDIPVCAPPPLHCAALDVLFSCSGGDDGGGGGVVLQIPRVRDAGGSWSWVEVNYAALQALDPPPLPAGSNRHHLSRPWDTPRSPAPLLFGFALEPAREQREGPAGWGGWADRAAFIRRAAPELTKEYTRALGSIESRAVGKSCFSWGMNATHGPFSTVVESPIHMEALLFTLKRC